MLKFLKFFTSFLIFLHCVGVTQLLSVYSKDNSAFVRIVNMVEEETKKEKEGKSLADYLKEVKRKNFTFIIPSFYISKLKYFFCAKSRVLPQFITEFPTPPPDLNA